jgi:hypothetical protein
MSTGLLDIATMGEMPLRESLMHPRDRITGAPAVSVLRSRECVRSEKGGVQYKMKLMIGNTTMRTTRGVLRIPAMS